MLGRTASGCVAVLTALSRVSSAHAWALTAAEAVNPPAATVATLSRNVRRFTTRSLSMVGLRILRLGAFGEFIPRNEFQRVIVHGVLLVAGLGTIGNDASQARIAAAAV